MNETQLESNLTDYAASLAHQGRQAAAEIRTGSLALVDDYALRLEQCERHLTELLMAVSGNGDALVNLDAYVTGRERRATVAKRWAETACRGYSWMALTEPAAGRPGVLTAAVEEAGFEPERILWAPGLTLGEASAVCAALGLDQPEPLADLGARLEEWNQHQRAAVVARGEDPDDW